VDTYFLKTVQGMVEITPQVFFPQDFMHVHLMEFVEHYPNWWRANRDKLNKEEYEQYEKPLDLMVTLTVLYEN